MKQPKKNAAAQALAALGASKGGKARASAMAPEERSAVAKKAAQARWGTGMPLETHDGVLQIGPMSIQCSVLSDETRVLSVTAVSRLFASKRKGRRHGDGSSLQLPPFLDSQNIKPFLPEDLLRPLARPILYKSKQGGRTAFGYEATLLPQICEVILDAHKQGVLRSTQQPLADAAETLLRGFARVGIVALVDEATGHQADRARDALARILEKFIAKELRPWVKTFTPEFYEQMFRLRGWAWKGMSVNRPQAVAHYTKDLMYARLAPGVLEELKRVTPRGDDGKPRAKLFQSLTDNVGYPKLKEHLASVVVLMRISSSWEQFMDNVDRALPRYGETMKLLPPDPIVRTGTEEE